VPRSSQFYRDERAACVLLGLRWASSARPAEEHVALHRDEGEHKISYTPGSSRVQSSDTGGLVYDQAGNVVNDGLYYSI